VERAGASRDEVPAELLRGPVGPHVPARPAEPERDRLSARRPWRNPERRDGGRLPRCAGQLRPRARARGRVLERPQRCRVLELAPPRRSSCEQDPKAERGPPRAEVTRTGRWRTARRRSSSRPAPRRRRRRPC
jgi:hypothetical protein